MSLFDSLSKISVQIQSQRHLMKHSEDATILVSIQPFIRALGYDTQNLVEVFPQYNADAKSTGGEKVDYAIFRKGKPIIFIEAKAANISLNESNWKQLYNYFNAEVGLRFGILTNGIEYRFYTDLKVRNIMDKQPFMAISMLNLDKRLAKELEGFTKSSFDPERILNGAQRRQITRLLKQEMSQPSDEFVRHFARQVHSGRLTEAKVHRYGQLVKDAWQEVKNHETVIVKPPSEHKDDTEPEPDPPPESSEYIPVYGSYEGHRFEAELLRESVNNGLTIAGNQIRYNGELTGLKNAALMAIRSVNPTFEPKRTFPNGFKFWHVIDPADGKEHMIRYISGWKQTDEELRQRVLSS